MTDKERAQKIVDASMVSSGSPPPKRHRESIAAAIRETINQLQYNIADWQSPNEHMVIDVKDILILANELENLK
jgi:ribosomal silencing factor RsfS